MHAWVCDNPIGVEALTWKESPTPQPGPGEVVIAIRAASLNFPDLLIVQNKYQMKPPLPFVPGSEYAGVVEAVGAGVGHLKPGDAVAAFAGTGGFATHACVNAAQVTPLPPGFAFDDAAAFVLTYATTHHALLDRAQLKAGETVLVLGAAGGVGTAAIQIAKAAGARVIAAASSDEKCAFCLQLGADATINYTSANLREELKRLTEGKGPDVVYDPVGGDLAEPVFRSIAWRGRSWWSGLLKVASLHCRGIWPCSKARRLSACSGVILPDASPRPTPKGSPNWRAGTRKARSNR